MKSTPGQWPGFSFPEGRRGRSHHVILGDGPVHIGMNKQSSQSVYLHGETFDIDPLIIARHPNTNTKWIGDNGEEHSYVDHESLLNTTVVEVILEGHKIEIFWADTDNYYMHIRLTQPDDNIWIGWSGYGVGAGLEDCGYGYSTEDIIGASEDVWKVKLR
ncbi:MAG: hypothetical protein JKY22_12200 [Flavobacteriaceae bacterium]|nr:hypothetical protein [Flavobacteriaceae bacterium]